LDLKVLIEKNLGYSLFMAIEATKIALSGADSSLFRFEKEAIAITKDISIGDYNEMIGVNIKKIDNYIDTFLDKNGIIPEQIDTVFMTGGSAQVRALVALLQSKFGKEKMRSGDFLNSVSQGLAWSYYN
jgi:hypothetical chaperone protein